MSFSLTGLKRLTLLWVATALAVSYIAQLQYDSWRRFGPPKIQTTYNIFIEPQPPNSETALLASFGAREFLADWYWLKTIQYYGGGDPYGKYRKLAELFDVVVTLSPKFLAAYQTGLIILPGEGFVEEAIALGKGGQRNLPDRWELPYYTGLVYHIYKKDYRAAAEQFTQAASLPGAPPIVQYFSGVYRNLANERQLAYEIFRTVAATSESDFIKERAAKYVLHLEVIFQLEDALKSYQARFKRLPDSFEALVAAGILGRVPQSPLGITLVLDRQTGAILETKR